MQSYLAFFWLDFLYVWVFFIDFRAIFLNKASLYYLLPYSGKMVGTSITTYLQ